LAQRQAASLERQMDLSFVIVIQVLYGVTSLALMGLGLAVIFGMMRVINFAHGEFMMIGGYVILVATRNGINIWFAMLVLAPIVTGLIGLIFERILIRFLYGPMIHTLIATWGLSLFLIGVATIIFGNVTAGVKAPLGFFSVGPYNIADYTLVIIVITLVVYVLAFVLFRYTKFGLIARATLSNPEQAAALGVSTPKVYMATFGIGSALTGMAGALLAPMNIISPTIGAAYIGKVFITVISGGTAAIVGTATASSIFGTLAQLVTFETTPVLGQVALLVAAIILLRVLPQGITGRFFRRAM
jgi:branched-subunit amino acid ABC-type transport system permease component